MLSLPLTIRTTITFLNEEKLNHIFLHESALFIMDCTNYMSAQYIDILVDGDSYDYLFDYCDEYAQVTETNDIGNNL